MQTSGLDMNDTVTLMVELMRAAKLEHRIVFKADKSTLVTRGILYTCQLEVPAIMDGEWMRIESIQALAQYVAKYA